MVCPNDFSLTLYRYGLLTPGEGEEADPNGPLSQFRTHVSACPDCARRLEAMRHRGLGHEISTVRLAETEPRPDNPWVRLRATGRVMADRIAAFANFDGARAGESLGACLEALTRALIGPNLRPATLGPGGVCLVRNRAGEAWPTTEPPREEMEPHLVDGSIMARYQWADSIAARSVMTLRILLDAETPLVLEAPFQEDLLEGDWVAVLELPLPAEVLDQRPDGLSWVVKSYEAWAEVLD